MHLLQGTAQVRQKVLEITGRCLVGSANQHIVPARLSVLQKDKARGFPQTTLGTVAGDGIADLFGTSVADAHSSVFFASIVCLQQK